MKIKCPKNIFNEDASEVDPHILFFARTFLIQLARKNTGLDSLRIIMKFETFDGFIQL